MPSVSIIGIGRVGGALALALDAAACTVDVLVHRRAQISREVADRLPTAELRKATDSFESIRSDTVLITTADADIGPVVEKLAGELAHKPVVLHTSGALDSTVLGPLSDLGIPVGSMHPLVSLSDAVTGAENLRGAYFCIEGDEAARRRASGIADRLGGRPFSIETRFKPLYHAAAVMTSGHFVALIDTAIGALSRCGVSREDAQQMLMPLIKTTVRNLESKEPNAALTGSFARADHETIERHIRAIQESAPDAAEAYLLLGERSLDLAESNGVDTRKIAKARESISMAKRKAG